MNMKKIITCGIAAAICACAISAQAFAADILTDRSVYAENGQSIYIMIKQD